MQKIIYSEKIGGDGGAVEVGTEAGNIKLAFSFPILKIITPLTKKIKDLIPGEKYDKYVDDLAEAGLKALGIDVPAADPQALSTDDIKV